MAIKDIFANSTLAKYARVIQATPREIIFNKQLLLSTLLYATASMPLSKYDQIVRTVVLTALSLGPRLVLSGARVARVSEPFWLQ